MKKRICGWLTFVLLFCLLTPHRVSAMELLKMELRVDGRTFMHEQYAMDLFVNGQPLTDLPMEPVLLNSRTYVPVREVFESMGAVVDWNSDRQQVYIGYGDTLIMLQIGSTTMQVGSQSFTIEVPPLLINNKTMVPVRFAAEALSFIVTTDWTAEHRHIFIDAPQSQPPTATPAPTPPPVKWDSAGLTESVDMSSQVIPAMRYPETSVTAVQTPAAGAAQVYTILASSEISRVEKMLLYDDRLVIDIYNATIGMRERAIEIAGNPILAGIRAAQNQVTPEKITRVVFDILSPTAFSVAIAPDRRSISVVLGTEVRTNEVSAWFTTDGVSDYLILEGQNSAPAASLFTLTGNDRLVVDIPASAIAENAGMSVPGQFAYRLRTGQFEGSTARVVLDLFAAAAYNVSTEGNRTVVQLVSSTVRNVEYSTADSFITIDKASTGLRAADIAHLDEYNQYRYTFTLPGDYSASLGHGEYTVNDGMISSFTIRNLNGMTQIVVKESRVLAFDVTEDANSIYIRAMLPREKYERIVVIDPGHGAQDPGTSGFGMTEKEVNLDVALKLITLLESDGRVKVYSTRVEDVYPTLSERAKFANEIGDLFVSIHHNAVENRPTISGTETHYYAHSNDATAGITCKAVAAIMQKHTLTLGFKDRKLFSSNFQVLRETTIPAVLLECGYLTNQEENSVIATQDYRIRAAIAIYEGILEVFSNYRPAR